MFFATLLILRRYDSCQAAMLFLRHAAMPATLRHFRYAAVSPPCHAMLLLPPLMLILLTLMLFFAMLIAAAPFQTRLRFRRCFRC